MSDTFTPDYLAALALLVPYVDHEHYERAVNAVHRTARNEGGKEALRHAARIAEEFEEVTLRAAATGAELGYAKLAGSDIRRTQ